MRQDAIASRGVVVGLETPTVAVAAVEVPPTVAIAPVATAGGGVAGGESAVPIVAPRVTFGNGRAPVLLSERPGELPVQMSLEPIVTQLLPAIAAPPAPSPSSARSSVAVPAPLTMESSTWPLSETPVTSFWGQVQPGWPASVLFGFAGLLLAPIGGVWLGRRQARAAKVATQLVRH